MKKTTYLLLLSLLLSFSGFAQLTPSHKQGIKINAASSTGAEAVGGLKADGTFVKSTIILDSIAIKSDLPTKLSDITDDIGATDGILPLSVLLDPINGNNNTAELENFEKPFQSMDALINALPAFDNETYTIYITGGSIDLTIKMPTRNLKFIAYKETVLDFTNVKEDDGITNATNVLYLDNNIKGTWTFENKNISILCTQPGGKIFTYGNTTGETVTLSGGINELDWASSVIGNTGNLNAGDNSNLYIETVKRGVINCQGKIEVNTWDKTNSIHLFHFAKEVIINNIISSNGLGGTFKTHKNSGGSGIFDLSIGNINKLGSITVLANNTTFLKSIITSNNVNVGGAGEITGKVVQNTGTMYARPYTQQVRFVNFSGELDTSTLFVNGRMYFENCNITTNGTLVKRYNLVQASVIEQCIDFKGFNTITQTNTSIDLFGEGTTGLPINLKIEGAVYSNAKSYGLNVSYIQPTATFKEKLGEVVVRSKKDLANRVLDPTLTYIVDGDLIFTANDSIIVPYVAGQPNLTINSYGLEAGSITKTGTNALFTSPIGGSGGLQMDAIKLKCNGCPIFDIEDATGFNAVELVKVNFEDSGSIGTMDGYRQYLWSNVGVFNVDDGITFEGASLGGFRSETVIVRNLAGTTGTLFKKGTSLTFGSRFFKKSNVDLPTGWEFTDFNNANFTNPETLQLQGVIITRAGVSDPTDALYTPNITEEDTASKWSDNIGMPNSSVLFQKIKSPDGTVYKIEVSNAGVITTTAQ